MNAVSEDIKDLLVAEGGFVFGTDLFIGHLPVTPKNCIALYDTSNQAPEGTVNGAQFLREGLQVIIRNENYSGAMLIAQGLLSLLNNKANFTINETWYLYVNLMNGPNSLGAEAGAHLLSLNFNIQRKSTVAPAVDFLTFAKLVQLLLAGTGIELEVDTEAETITIINTGGGGGTVYWNDIEGKPSTFPPSSHTHAQSEIVNLISALGLKVDKVTGKQLSTNDYTTTEKNKLANLATVATSGAYNDLSGKPTIPTKTSDLTNDSGFIGDAPSDGNQYARKDAAWEQVAAAQSDKLQALTDGANIAWNVADGNKATVTITGNQQFANPTNLVAGLTLVLHQTQDGVGGRVPTFGSYFKFPAGIVPTPSSTAGATDIYEFEVVSTTVIRLTNFIKGY